MEVGDCSLWHHLIFCEKMESDGNNKGVCWLCEESVLGRPAYKCLECNFLQHKSCSAMKMHVEHNLRERHHLMFKEELNNTANKEVVCLGCEEPVFGPNYKCSIPECSFLLHKSCSELSHVIQHPMHPEHALFLQVPSRNSCDVCQQDCTRSFFYRCFTCDFDIDIKCVSRWRISADDCHQHALCPTRKQIQFTCEACAEESKGIAYQCSICRVFIHRKCAPFQHTIKTTIHDHSLTRNYSLSQVKKQEENAFCKLCRKKVNTEYAAYYCQECDYIAHMECATYFKVEGRDLSETMNEVDANQLVHLVEGIDLAEDERVGPREINHFNHPQHKLILIDEKLMEDKRCEACMQFIIIVPFYGCVKCNYFLHNRCAKVLPSTIKRGLFHEHRLTLISKDSNVNAYRRLFCCDVCGYSRHGFRYKCEECSCCNGDIQCCLIPEILKHEGHQHLLFLALRDSYESCNGCGDKRSGFVCTKCDKFALCIRCATLPLVARHQHDTHLLKLSYTREDDSGEYYCRICEKERNHPDHWFYYCVKCDFSAHRQCVLGENPYIT
ncbi:uncharacterized protein LOC133881347 [Alnus glutinosa]|uniref:uncharacterized protein LOC133881347 n=1 Tax=Alnus glutinosa TaxID=3517 RepID=UPI002D785127|nr:uncharacterized protein LOC133881347 [Alnus glutinosa]